MAFFNKQWIINLINNLFFVYTAKIQRHVATRMREGGRGM